MQALPAGGGTGIGGGIVSGAETETGATPMRQHRSAGWLSG